MSTQLLFPESQRTRLQGSHSFIFSFAKMLCWLRSSITFGSEKIFLGGRTTEKQTQRQTSASIKVRAMRLSPVTAAAAQPLRCALRARNTAFHSARHKVSRRPPLQNDESTPRARFSVDDVSPGGTRARCGGWLAECAKGPFASWTCWVFLTEHEPLCGKNSFPLPQTGFKSWKSDTSFCTCGAWHLSEIQAETS